MPACVSYALDWHDAVTTSTCAFKNVYIYILLKLRAITFLTVECHSESDIMRLASFMLLTLNLSWLRPSATMTTRAVSTLTVTVHFDVLDDTAPLLPFVSKLSIVELGMKEQRITLNKFL